MTRVTSFTMAHVSLFQYYCSLTNAGDPLHHANVPIISAMLEALIFSSDVIRKFSNRAFLLIAIVRWAEISRLKWFS